MRGLRRHCRRHPGVAAALIALALLLRALVPGGLMPQWSAAGLTLTICSGVTSGETLTVALAPGGEHAPHGQEEAHKLAPCGFAGLAAPTLGGGDPLLLAVAILIGVVAAGYARSPAPPRRSAALRPPLRGPPA